MKLRSNGYTLVELMVTVAVLGILTGLAIDSGQREWRREQVNGVVIELSGWLESVRRSALRGYRCNVTFTEGTLSAGDTLATGAEASTSPQIGNNCLASMPLQIPSVGGGSQVSVTANYSGIAFTPRGTVAQVASGDPLTANVPADIIVTLQPNGPSRCVRVESLLGLISIGQVTNGVCQPDTRF